MRIFRDESDKGGPAVADPPAENIEITDKGIEIIEPDGGGEPKEPSAKVIDDEAALDYFNRNPHLLERMPGFQRQPSVKPEAQPVQELDLRQFVDDDGTLDVEAAQKAIAQETRRVADETYARVSAEQQAQMAPVHALLVENRAARIAKSEGLDDDGQSYVESRLSVLNADTLSTLRPGNFLYDTILDAAYGQQRRKESLRDDPGREGAAPGRRTVMGFGLNDDGRPFTQKDYADFCAVHGLDQKDAEARRLAKAAGILK